MSQEQDVEGVLGENDSSVQAQLQDLTLMFRDFITVTTNANEEIKGELAALRNEQTLTNTELLKQEEQIERLSTGGSRTQAAPTVQLDTTRFGAFSSPSGIDSSIYRRNSIRSHLHGGQQNPTAEVRAEEEKNKSKPEEEQGKFGYGSFFGLQTHNRLTANPQLQVSVAMQEIKAEDKMQTISTNSVLRIVEKFKEYRSSSSAHDVRGFDEFISQPVQRMLIDNEKALDVPFCSQLRYDTFHNLNQNEILCMLARYIRSQNVTKQEFLKVFVKALREFQLDRDDRNSWTVQTNGWSKHAQKPLSEWIQRAYDVHFFLTCGVIKDEVLPNETYAKDPDVGLIRASVECLGVLKDTVVMFMTEDSLKRLKSFPEFLAELKKMNEHLQKSDRAIMRENAKITPVTPYKDLVSGVLQKLDTFQKNKRAHYEDRKKEIEKSQQSSYRGNAQAPRSTGFTGGRFNRFEGEEDSEDENQVKRGALIYGEEDSGSDQDVKESEPEQSNAQETQNQIDSSLIYKVVDDEGLLNAYNRMEYAEKGSVKKLTDSMNPQMLVCFEKIDKGKCEIKDCKYNHKTEDCRNHVIKAFLKASRSPLVTSEELGKLITQAKNPASSPSTGLPTTTAIPRFHSQVRTGGGSGGLRNQYPHTGHVREMVSQDGVTNAVNFSSDS